MAKVEDRVMNVIEKRVRDGKREIEKASAPVEPGGLAGWVLGVIRGRAAKTANRHMQIVETLSLGGRRQLMLVTCDDEKFLVGSGADRVETIVRVGRASEETWA